MSTKSKKPSLATKLRVATEQAVAADKANTALTGKLEQTERMRDHYSSQNNEARAELSQIHAFLDSVPNAPARSIEGEYGGKTAIGAMTRLSVFLATRG